MTEDISRAGWRMMFALSCLREAGGEVTGRVEFARKVGPNGSARYGGDVIDRCIARGWISATIARSPRPTTLRLTQSGREALQLWRKDGVE